MLEAEFLEPQVPARVRSQVSARRVSRGEVMQIAGLAAAPGGVILTVSTRRRHRIQ
jgi:hypothetical protein